MANQAREPREKEKRKKKVVPEHVNEMVFVVGANTVARLPIQCSGYHKTISVKP